ncbi:MAG: C39 family peptidase [Lachnospiraceae bacterium]|nr:C39 family peptidase [Lachnospiraceae bacterium]
MRKKLINGLVLILLILGICKTGSVYADEKGIEIVDGLVIDEDTAIPLYNNEEDVAAYYIEGNDNGYMILDSECNVVEFSYQNSIDDFEDSDTDCYYGGPGNYYVEDECDSDMLINISSDEKLEKDEIEDFEICEEIDIKENTGIVNRGSASAKGSATITLPDGIRYSDGRTTYTDKIYNTLTLKSKASLPYHTRYFSYNTEGTCGSTAAAIFTYYYYDHVAKSYIKSNKYKKSQEEFVEAYKELLKDEGKGTKYRDVKNGINKYLKSIGKKQNCTYITKWNLLSTIISKIKNRINHKRPCIVGLTGEPRFNEHWVVGIGYASYYGINGRSRGYVNFIKVNSGNGYSFSGSVVYVNYKYVDCAIYLE